MPNLPTHPEEAEQMRRMTPQGAHRSRDTPPHRPQGSAAGRTAGTCSPLGFQRRGGAPPAGDPDGSDDDDDDRGKPGRHRSAPFNLPGDRKGTHGTATVPSLGDGQSS